MDTHSVMITKVQKWGNSLGVRLPKAAAQEAGVSAGSEVDVSAVEGRIVVRPLSPKRPRLRDLLAGIRRDNLHAEAFLGAARGREQL